MPDLAQERRHRGIVCGIDEAGRGPLAGPVVAAAVVLRPGLPEAVAALIDDSKALTPRWRLRAFDALAALARRGGAAIGVGAASAVEIDAVNILEATHLAMRRAVARLGLRPDLALIDGNRIPPGLACEARAIVGGDAISLSIAAASIVAKVTRDRAMARLALRYPAYAWDSNMGYGAPAHLAGLALAGPSPHHRLSFAPLRQYTLSL